MKNIRMEVLTRTEMEQIHDVTLKVLSNVGIQVNHADAREIYKKAGCEVDEKTRIVRMPPSVVEKAISTCPSAFTLNSRDKKHDVKMVSDGSIVNFLTFGIGTKVTNFTAPGQYDVRKSTLEDIGKIAKVTDACENIDWICSPVSAMDLAAADRVRSLREVNAIITNTSKPVLIDPEPQYMPYYFDMMKACYGGDEEEARKRPFFVVGSCPSSPLQLDQPICEFAIHSGEYGMPMMVLSMAMGAASSPIHLAGTLVTHNAEVLAGIVLTQLARPGHPTFYGSSTTSFDFYTNSAPVGSPELGMISAGVAQLAQFYHIPCITAGS